MKTSRVIKILTSACRSASLAANMAPNRADAAGRSVAAATAQAAQPTLTSPNRPTLTPGAVMTDSWRT